MNGELVAEPAKAPSPDVDGLRTPLPFDLYGELPSGTTVLEASAGTGKTFTIAALVTRFVAEGIGLNEMLIVTFSRAATGELRERVRERLTGAERALADPGAARSQTHDPLIALLAEGSDAQVALRRLRLTKALTTFDAATIATTHQFCAQVLAGLGVTADLAALSGGDRFVESLADLVVEATQDLYLRKFAGPQAVDGSPVIPPREAVRIALEAVVSEPQARLEPLSASPESLAGMRRGLAVAVRQEVGIRKRIRGVRSYDDLQTDLAAVLGDPEHGRAACRRLQERYPVVLIDEFQDTDPVQWQIVSRAFVGAVKLVLIGDPKQAIYGFRGADVTAYLKAVRAADVVATLVRNWRSEQRLLDALDVVFAGCTFGNPRIAYRMVQAATEQPLLRGAPVSAPLRLRILPRGPGDQLTSKRLLRVDLIRPRIAADVAADIVALLSSDAEVCPAAAEPAGFRHVEPGDVAVLVRTNGQAMMVRDALRSCGVPAVIGGASSVFTAPVARDWLILLEALEQPHRGGRVRAAAMTCFLDWSAEQLAMAAPHETDALTALVRSWANVLTLRGVAALQETITSSQQLPARLLSHPDGERRLTDLRHIGEALHAAASAGALGITALVAWLRRRIDEADEATDGMEERSRRLDSDADAVQVVTIHRSKGLEFPVVYVPFAWDQYQPDVLRPRYHDENDDRVLDVGSGLAGSDPAAFSEGVLRHKLEEAAEQLRLLYVALTRARSQVVLWWAPGTTSDSAPLSRLLFGVPRPPGEVATKEPDEPAISISIPDDTEIWRRLETLASTAGGTIALEQAGVQRPTHWDGAAAPPTDLRAAVFDRTLDLTWRRTSYSGLTAAAHDAGMGLHLGHRRPLGPLGHGEAAVGSEPEEGTLDDEPIEAVIGGSVTASSADGEAAAVQSPMAELPGGTSFGSLVHGVLETVDVEAVDFAGEVEERIGEQLVRWGPAGGARASLDPAKLTTALLAVYESPLGPCAGDRRLRDFGAGDRLTELSFELPLAGGDHPGGGMSGGELTLGSLAPLLRKQLGAKASNGCVDPLSSYSDRLTEPLLRDQPLRGFLNGSLDAVLRVRDPAGAAPDRFVIVDYKTNWLAAAAPGSGQLTAADYTPARLAAAMLGSDYPLQALLYSVALHRYLRWRQRDYSPEQHLGGALYLYVRGMCGPHTPVIDGQPCGVFAWQPPAGLVTELSDLLDSGQVAR